MRTLIILACLLATPAYAVQWDVLREDGSDDFLPVTEALPNTTLIDGKAVYDDGFASDGSDWGDDESNAISTQQAAWQAADPEGHVYACSWHHGS